MEEGHTGPCFCIDHNPVIAAETLRPTGPRLPRSALFPGTLTKIIETRESLADKLKEAHVDIDMGAMMAQIPTLELSVAQAETIRYSKEAAAFAWSVSHRDDEVMTDEFWQCFAPEKIGDPMKLSRHC